jgi:hypothetical protein
MENNLMNLQGKFLRMTLLSVAFILMSFTVSNAQDSEWSFKVTNKTKTTIKRLLVAEPNKKYKDFDIGKGILPGETATLIWNKATDDESCKQWFKAVYSDGVETEAAYVDFCEDDVHLDFNR